MLPPAPPRSSPLRRFALSGVALLVVLVVLLSCMGETPTSPKKSGITYASGLRFNTIFPAAFQNSAFADIVTFDRVRVVIRRLDTSIALDTIVNFPANVNEITLELNIPISPGASSTGEDLMVSLGYLSAANDTVFKGTKQITATPSLPGQPAQAPVTIPVVYTGPGASATAVRITPRQISVNGGGAFTFTAVGVDGTGATVPNTPISWSSADPARATITSASAGSGVALNQRGPARIIASLITGKADTAIVDVSLPPSAIAAVSGNNQVGVIGKPIARPFGQPLVVKVSASDGGGAAGVTVNFAAVTGGGSVSPASAVTDANGNSQTTWTPGNNVGTQTATASAVGLNGSPVTFTATANLTVATKLVFTASPTAGMNVDAQASINVTVAAQDLDGDLVSTFAAPVTISIGTGPNGSALSGTATVNAVAGVATFTNLGIALPGSGYVLNAASAGLTNAATAAFNIINGAPTSIALVSGGGQTAPASSVLSPITVVLKDAAGNPTANVDVTFAVATGGGSVVPVTVTTDGLGQASTTWTLGSASGTQTLTATSSGLSPLTVSATATTSTTNNQVVITQSVSNTQTAGVTVTQPLIAEIRSAAGALLTNYNGNVTIGISANPGHTTLIGTTTVAAVGGIATFNAFSINKAAAGYTLVVSTPGATNGTSAAFTVAPAAPAVLVLQSGGGQSGQPNAALPAAILARVDDAFGNGIDNLQLNFAVSAGGGSVSPTTANTANGGAAFTTWTLGAQGTQTLTITSPALPNAPLSVSATFGPGAPVTTVVTPQRDTITAFTDTRTITAQGRDAAGNLVAGNWTWTSRTPSVATVSASGVVTSVVDGSTYIVATEAGGSKDSSLIVVQQRVATVNVNPPSRSIYNGAQFTFTAQAVDGRGVAMVTQPALVWTSSVPSIATITAGGLATGVALGSTQIRATAGSAVGVSTLTVLTPITRIDVSYDSTNAPAPDVFTMTSLGDTRLYKAVARDTLLNVMPGITFTWNSTNASVALIDSTTPFKARALSAANGVTGIQASAQGVTGSATLNVAQVLNSIDLSPPTATVAVSGQISMLARGKDANGRFISGGTFTYSSSAPNIASVNSTGVVTGLLNGTTNITALNGTITSNIAVVAVNNSGPAIISFGRDTIGIGRGSSVPIPIYLSKPNATPVTVNLAVADTFAVWTTASVTVPANGTTASGILSGRSAGTTLIYAVDGNNTLYAGDTAVLAVQANLRMATTNYSLIATDQIATQVLLSDPSPAGGTYVTFGYGTAGKASASPNPAFIPAGQLASNVVITGVAAGSTTITPSATGVTGTAAFISVSPPVLSFNTTQVRLGSGQYDANSYYIASPSNLNTPLTVTLTSLDTSIAISVPSVTIAANSFRAFFNPTARARGTTSIIATAPGWTPDTFVVISTTPHVRAVAICCNGLALNVTSPSQTVGVYAADSVTTVHYRTSSLAVRLSSSDTTVIRVIDTLLTIGANAQNSTGLIRPGGVGGTAWVYATASGHSPDSIQYTVVGPRLTLNYSTNYVGLGLYQRSVTVNIPNAITSPLVVTLNNSDPTKAGTPTTVTIPQGSTQASFNIRGLALGTSTVISSAPGYAPDTGVTIVNTPRIVLTNGGTLQNYQTSNANAFMADSTFVTQYRIAPIVVHFTSTNTQVLTVDSVSTVAADAQYNSQSPAIVTAVGPGTAQIIATAPGMTPDTTSWNVQAAKLIVGGPYGGVSNYLIGSRQHRQPNDFYVQTPTVRGVPVPVTLTQKYPSYLGLTPTSFAISANQNYGYFTIAGLLPGRDTVIASAPGYTPDTILFTVTTPRLSATSLPTTRLTTSPPYPITIYATDSTAGSFYNQHYVSDTVVVRAVSSDSTVIKPSQPFIRILKGTLNVTANVVFVGPGSAYMVYSDSGTGYRPDTTNTVTVTGPSLTITTSSNSMLGMRQMSSPNQYSILTTNPVTAPLTVNLISTDPRVLSVPASLTIPTGQSRVYFDITALDTIGTIQIQATAAGYGLGTMNIQVTAPKFVISTAPNQTTTSPPYPITVIASDASGTQHPVVQAVTVTLTSSSPGVAAIDSATVTIPAGLATNSRAKWTPGAVGSAQLTASDSRTQAYYRYLTGTTTVNVTTPALSLNYNSATLGIGQFINQYVYVPNSLQNPLTVSIGHSASPHSNTPSSVVIAANSYQSPLFRIVATSQGTDTLTMSAPGHTAATTLVNVGLGRIDPLSGWPSQVTAGDSTLITLYVRDQQSGFQTVAAATTFTLAPNANVQFMSGGANSAVITSVTVPANGQYVQFYLKGVSAGAGSASITSPNYSPYSNSLTVLP